MSKKNAADAFHEIWKASHANHEFQVADRTEAIANNQLAIENCTTALGKAAAVEPTGTTTKYLKSEIARYEADNARHEVAKKHHTTAMEECAGKMEECEKLSRAIQTEELAEV